MMEKKGRRFIEDPDEPMNSNEPIDVDDSLIDGPVVEESIDDEPVRPRTKPAPADDEPEEAQPGKRDGGRFRESKRDERLKEKNAKKLKKKMKNRARDEKPEDDEPDDELPTEERPAKPSRRLNKKRIVLAAVILAVVFVAVFLFANADKLSLHNITNFVRYGIFNSDNEERFPVDVQGDSITAGNFARMGQDLCCVSDTRLQMVNNYGKKLFSYQHGFTTPVLAYCDKYSLVFGLGGAGYQISTLDETVYVGEADNNILLADIVDNGTYAFVTQSDGYLAKLSVYDKDNNRIFAYSFADYYITALSLCSDGRHATLAGLSAIGGAEISSLYVLDFTKDTPAQFAEIEDNIIYDVCYLNDTYAAAVGSSGAFTINTRSGALESYSFDGRTLTAYDFNKSTSAFSISLSRSGDGRNCDVVSFRSNGTVSDSFSTELRVIGMSVYKGNVALLSTDALYLYGKNGRKINSKSAGIDPKAVVLYTSSDAYVLDTSEIRSVSL